MHGIDFYGYVKALITVSERLWSNTERDLKHETGHVVVCINIKLKPQSFLNLN